MNRNEYIDDKKRGRARVLCDTMKLITNIDPMESSRRRDVVTCRMMISQRLMIEGWTENQIGTILQRDHATINHYRDKFVEMMTTPGYEAEREIWAKFTLAV